MVEFSIKHPVRGNKAIVSYTKKEYLVCLIREIIRTARLSIDELKTEDVKNLPPPTL